MLTLQNSFSVVYFRLSNLNKLINVKNLLLGVHCVKWIVCPAPSDRDLESDLWLFDLVSNVCLKLDLLLALADAGSGFSVNAWEIMRCWAAWPSQSFWSHLGGGQYSKYEVHHHFGFKSCFIVHNWPFFCGRL